MASKKKDKGNPDVVGTFAGAKAMEFLAKTVAAFGELGERFVAATERHAAAAEKSAATTERMHEVVCDIAKWQMQQGRGLEEIATAFREMNEHPEGMAGG